VTTVGSGPVIELQVISFTTIANVTTEQATAFSVAAATR
jgi:hypothetical protein